MVKLDGDRIIVPAIQRRKYVILMFEQYKTKLNSEPTVTRRSFYRLAGVLMHGTTQLRTAVNYVTGFLVNDTFELLGRIARDLLPDSSETVVQRMDLLREWLKYGGEYVDEGGDTLDKDHCPRHAIQFGLAEPRKPCSNVSSTSIARYKPTASCELNEEERYVSCSAFAAMYILLDDFSINLEKAAPDPSTFEVVRDAYEKMELYLGHRVRVSNQQRALQYIADDIKADCIANKCLSEAIVIIDYKMKMEPLYYREKTVDHYGKLGLSWHGALIRYWSFDPASGDAHETKVYLDQIANGDNKQDKDAVVALVEGILMSIHLAFPFIKKVTFQSDNASCYQNTFVAVILPLLGSVHGIEVVRYVHSETQDGKCILDAHFMTAMRKIKGWVRQGHNCTTPTEVVTALNSDGGMPNCLAELVDYDRVKMDVLGSQVGPVAKALSKIISRFNDVVYDRSGFIDCSQCQQSFDIQSWPPFKMSIFEYSGVGDGLSISVEPSRGLCSNSNTQPTTQATEPVQIEVEDGNADGTTDEALFDEAGQCDSVYSSDSDTEDGNLVFETDFAQNNHDRLDPSDTLLPSRSTGVITRISISRRSCIKLRTRSTQIPRTRVFATNMNYSEREIKSNAKRCLLGMQSGGHFHDIVQASDVTTKLIGVANECNQRARTIKTLSCGWARRPKKGFMYGAKYMGHYKEEIEELFNRGEVDPSKKLTPARMLEHLTKKYPRRYNLPVENEIRTRISMIMQNRRKLLKSKQTKPTSASNPKQN